METTTNHQIEAAQATTTRRAWRRRTQAKSCTCIECGTPFVSIHPTRAKFCSNACRQHAKRGRDAAAQLELVAA